METQERLEPAGPPELPQAQKPEVDEHVSPQLIRSTKSTMTGEKVEDEADAPDVLNEHVEEPGDPDGVVAAEEEHKLEVERPAPFAPVAKKRRKRWPVVLLVLLVLAAGAAGAYWFGSHKKASAPGAKQPTGTHATTSKSSDAPVPTKHYDSVTYTLGFDYPETWKVSDTAAKLSVTSPAVQLTGVDGKTVEGHVAVNIQNQQATIAGYPAGGALASLASDKLTYKQPTSVQRAQTYLSYLSYKQTNGLDVLYITGDNGYQQGQQVPMSDVAKANPLISVTFETCKTADCSTGTPTPITLLANDWKAASASKDITTLLQSITLN